jgi:pyruvate/2-oxoglutarate dehydrogenase complex dihydrolipoamide acyltransferase (E2) component
MSEEKPTFKVTDRRLFNPDGTPRDIPREEAPAPPPEPKPAAPAATEQTAAEPARTPAPAPADAASPRAPEREAAPEAQPEAQGDEGFLMLVEFLASFAADALGMVNHPGGGGVNLPLAKQCIDMLGTLHRKTHGNLVAEEQQFLDMILSQLRMQYVSLTSAPRPPQGGGPRGFSGGDITGGR